MALQPSLSPFLIGSKSSPHTLEFWYDIVCPFSKKSYNTTYNLLKPWVLEGKLKDKVQILLRLQPQPWHASSQLTHEAVLAVARVAPDQLLEYLDALYKVSEQFYDIPSSNSTPVQLREKILDVGIPILGEEKVAKAKDLLVLRSTPNGGNAVTDDLKYFIKLGRQNGIHVSPTVTWDGLVASDVYSSWAEAEWTKFFDERVKV
ncbi:hypothetical protein FRB94_000162 [Tulasnella sp. JGI-2019a]|nr:hypothetical protein FRB94_000162 [Tulasnella sp. JGI-2019a]